VSGSNGGRSSKTPALLVRAVFSLEKLDITQQPTFKAPANKVTTGAIFPTDAPSIAVSWLRRPNLDSDAQPATVSSEDLKDWKAGKIYFALSGEVKYWDIFGIEHWTHYCASRSAPGLKLSANIRIADLNSLAMQTSYGPASFTVQDVSETSIWIAQPQRHQGEWVSLRFDR
jgi:hypothetical protein